MSDRMDINRVLMEMRAIKSQTQAFNGPNGVPGKDQVNPLGNTDSFLVDKANKGQGENFGDVFTQAIDKVNDAQKTSANLATAYEQGDPNVDITEVMVASQKASVAFQSMVQVRNKLVEAYRDVMNMPI